MNILDKIEEIQAKPEHKRRQIMYVVLGICMVIVFFVWMASFKNTLNSGNTAAVSASNQTSPVDYVKDVINDITNNGPKTN